MAILVMINNTKTTVWNGIRYESGNFKNADAVENLIHYITRTRENENRAGDLVTCGAVGACCYQSAEDIIQQFEYVQNVYKINSRKGRRMYHEVLNLLDHEVAWLNNASEWLWRVGIECCQVYFQMGFQAAFAVHYEESKHYHFHFAVNSISFVDGRKWHTSIPEKDQRESIFNEILNKNQILAGRKASPIMYLKNAGEIETYCSKGKI